MLPVAFGCALAFRLRNERRVALGWLGDGGSARGDAHEAMNFAGVRRLPVVFVIDNNEFAYSTPTSYEYAVRTWRTAPRPTASTAWSWTAPTCSRSTARRSAAIEKARAGGGPTLIECVTLRMEGHAVHDDAFYVPKSCSRRGSEGIRSSASAARACTPRRTRSTRPPTKRVLNEALRRVDEARAGPGRARWPEPAELDRPRYH